MPPILGSQSHPETSAPQRSSKMFRTNQGFPARFCFIPQLPNYAGSRAPLGGAPDAFPIATRPFASQPRSHTDRRRPRSHRCAGAHALAASSPPSLIKPSLAQNVRQVRRRSCGVKPAGSIARSAARLTARVGACGMIGCELLKGEAKTNRLSGAAASRRRTISSAIRGSGRGTSRPPFARAAGSVQSRTPHRGKHRRCMPVITRMRAPKSSCSPKSIRSHAFKAGAVEGRTKRSRISCSVRTRVRACSLARMECRPPDWRQLSLGDGPVEELPNEAQGAVGVDRRSRS